MIYESMSHESMRLTVNIAIIILLIKPEPSFQ